MYGKKFPFDALVCHFLVNGTGAVGFGKKITECDMREGGSENTNLRVVYFLNAPELDYMQKIFGKWQKRSASHMFCYMLKNVSF